MDGSLLSQISLNPIRDEWNHSSTGLSVPAPAVFIWAWKPLRQHLAIKCDGLPEESGGLHTEALWTCTQRLLTCSTSTLSVVLISLLHISSTHDKALLLDTSSGHHELPVYDLAGSSVGCILLFSSVQKQQQSLSPETTKWTSWSRQSHNAEPHQLSRPQWWLHYTVRAQSMEQPFFENGLDWQFLWNVSWTSFTFRSQVRWKLVLHANLKSVLVLRCVPWSLCKSRVLKSREGIGVQLTKYHFMVVMWLIIRTVNNSSHCSTQSPSCCSD